MKQYVKNLFILALLCLSDQVLGYEFYNFELKGKLKQANEEIKQQKKAIKEGRFMKAANAAGPSAKSNTDKQISPLLKELSGMLLGEYQNIGMAQTQRLIENHDLGGGVHNFSGFTWYKPMLNYQVAANRELAPHLNSSKWIVHDTFTIYVEAATLLSNLQAEGELEISKEAIGAFAGITFKRVYHYYQFADTYMDGLTKDYSKLFLSFARFNTGGALNLTEYEVMKKTDTFSFNGGGVLTAPLGSGLDLQSGVLVKTAYKNEVMLQHVGPEDRQTGEEFLRVSIEKKYDRSAGAHLSLQYDFFNLLKVSLLRFDLEYEYTESNKTYLGFSQSEKDVIRFSEPHRNEFNNFLKGKDEVHEWKHNITEMEKRIKENLTSKFSFLLFGTMKKRATEQIKIVRDGLEKVFFKNYSESVKYVQSLFSRLFQIVIHKIFDFESTVSNKAEIKKNMVIEYEHLKHLDPAKVEEEKQFSIRLKQRFFVSATHKWYHRTYYKSAIRHTQRLTNLPGAIVDKIKRKELRGPIRINSTMEIGEDGLAYFNNLSVDEVIQASLNICKVKKREQNQFFDDKSRRKLFRQRKLRGSKYCAKKMIKRYLDYIESYMSYNEIDLMKFKKFLGYYFSKAKYLSQIQAIFGQDYVFLHGDFSARTKTNRSFQNFFKAGQFRGLGVIDNFKQGNIVTPVDTRRND